METVSRCAAVAAVLLALAAMVRYPGGSVSDRSARRYSLFDNSLSDLGAAATVKGEPNQASATLFAASGIALAVAWLSVCSGCFGSLTLEAETGCAPPRQWAWSRVSASAPRS